MHQLLCKLSLIKRICNALLKSVVFVFFCCFLAHNLNKYTKSTEGCCNTIHFYVHPLEHLYDALQHMFFSDFVRKEGIRILRIKTYKKIFIEKTSCLQNKIYYETSYKYPRDENLCTKMLESKNRTKRILYVPFYVIEEGPAGDAVIAD